MRRPRGRGVSAAVMLLLTLAACHSKGPWQQEDDATPWIAPGERALAFYRTVENFGGANTSERVWRDRAGRDHVVLLMSPFDFGSPRGRSTFDILEPIGERRCLGNEYMINPLECDIAAR